jgi:hypothetical protein
MWSIASKLSFLPVVIIMRNEVSGYMAIAIGGSAMLIIFQGIFTTICLSIVVSIINANRQVLLATGIGTTIAKGTQGLKN